MTTATDFGPLMRSAMGERVRFTATVTRFAAKKNWQGLQQPTIVLTNICFADNGALVKTEQVFTRGVWDQDLHEGLRISFAARFDAVEKRDGSVWDMVLRPSRVKIL